MVVHTMRACGVPGGSCPVFAGVVRATSREECVDYPNFDHRRHLSRQGSRHAIHTCSFLHRVLSNFSAVNGAERFRCSVQVGHHRLLTFTGRPFVVNHCRLNARVAISSVACLSVVIALILYSLSAFFHRRQEINDRSIGCARIVYLLGLLRVNYIGGGLRALVFLVIGCLVIGSGGLFPFAAMSDSHC